MTTTAPITSESRPPQRWWNGRGELAVAIGVAALATVVLVGTATMDVPDGVSSPGPQFFPTIIGGFLLLLAVLLAIGVIRNPVRPAPDEPAEVSLDMLTDLGGVDSTTELRIVSGDPDLVSRTAEPSAPAAARLKPVIMIAAIFAVFILILEPVGWILSAALLFWVTAFALGSRRPLFDIGIALIISSLVQIAFSLGLGLNLPSGILTGVFAWIS